MLLVKCSAVILINIVGLSFLDSIMQDGEEGSGRYSVHGDAAPSWDPT